MANNDSKPSSLHMLQGIFFLIAFVVTILIISTDKNLQTDFGLVKPYFYHWYGLLTTGILSLIGGIVLIVKHDKMLEKVGVAGSAIIAIFLVADIATYSTTHWFPSAGAMANYLFGVTFDKAYASPGTYIPGLYDFLFAVYIITLIIGVFAVRKK